MTPDGAQALRQGDFRQASAPVERAVANALQALRQTDRPQRKAAVEGLFLDVRQPFRQRHAFHLRGIECAPPNRRDALRHSYIAHIPRGANHRVARQQHLILDAQHRVVRRNPQAVRKEVLGQRDGRNGVAVNFRQARRQRQPPQFIAVRKHPVAHAAQRVRQGDGFQIPAASKGSFSQRFHALRQRHLFQRAADECLLPDFPQGGWQRDFLQRRCRRKRFAVNHRHALRDDDARQRRIFKGIRANRRHGQIVYHGRNHQRRFVAQIARNARRSVLQNDIEVQPVLAFSGDFRRVVVVNRVQHRIRLCRCRTEQERQQDAEHPLHQKKRLLVP